jgi:hypothetical protein
MKLFNLQCVLLLVIGCSLFVNAEDDSDYDSAEESKGILTEFCG